MTPPPFSYKASSFVCSVSMPAHLLVSHSLPSSSPFEVVQSNPIFNILKFADFYTPAYPEQQPCLRRQGSFPTAGVQMGEGVRRQDLWAAAAHGQQCGLGQAGLHHG